MTRNGASGLCDKLPVASRTGIAAIPSPSSGADRAQ